MKYRTCKTCPFLKNSENIGAADWLLEVMQGIRLKKLDHSCHVTDPKADGYLGGSGGRHCVGFLGMVKKFSGQCFSPNAKDDIKNGKLEWDKISTAKVFDNPFKFMLYHAKFISEKEKT